MDILFEQRMQMLLKDEYQNFKTALLKKPIKAFYLNPKKKDVIQHLEYQYLTKHPYINDEMCIRDRVYALLYHQLK